MKRKEKLPTICWNLDNQTQELFNKTLKYQDNFESYKWILHNYQILSKFFIIQIGFAIGLFFQNINYFDKISIHQNMTNMTTPITTHEYVVHMDMSFIHQSYFCCSHKSHGTYYMFINWNIFYKWPFGRYNKAISVMRHGS
jgi:hypothetical protein